VSDHRRATPRTDVVLADPGLQVAAAHLGSAIVKRVVSDTLDRCRAGDLDPVDVVAAAMSALPESATSLRRVVNATGILIHTNLGRSPLSAAAIDAVSVAAGATDVELDLASGRRAGRGRGAIAALHAAVPAAEAVHIVNNGAAALSLTASVLARAKAIVVSRGELVEIGDGFRIPDLLVESGAELREVGTTNRVRLDDYASAVDESVGFILKVHPSNFVVRGFTSAVPVSALAALGAPVVADIGSGLLAPHPRLPDEPSASATLAAGAALVTASGDKLLGGPQCGLLVGRASIVDRLRRHPLARAFRVDKLTLAAVEATLCGPPTPIERFLATSRADLMARAEAIAAALMPGVDAEAVPSVAEVGGGSAPGVELASAAVSLPASLAAPLRLDRQSPVVGRVTGHRVLLDLAAVEPEADQAIVAAAGRAHRPDR
jgi:L-seryl-tRNA(Ser) seleniumtransferase